MLYFEVVGRFVSTLLLPVHDEAIVMLLVISVKFSVMNADTLQTNFDFIDCVKLLNEINFNQDIFPQ